MADDHYLGCDAGPRQACACSLMRAILEILHDAGIDTDDPAAGVRELAAQRDASYALIMGGALGRKAATPPALPDALCHAQVPRSEGVRCTLPLNHSGRHRDVLLRGAPPEEPAPEPRIVERRIPMVGIFDDAPEPAPEPLCPSHGKPVFDACSGCRRATGKPATAWPPVPAPESRCPECNTFQHWKGGSLHVASCSRFNTAAPKPAPEPRINGGTGNCVAHGVYKCPSCDPVPAPEPAPEPTDPPCMYCDGHGITGPVDDDGATLCVVCCGTGYEPALHSLLGELDAVAGAWMQTDYDGDCVDDIREIVTRYRAPHPSVPAPEPAPEPPCACPFGVVVDGLISAEERASSFHVWKYLAQGLLAHLLAHTSVEKVKRVHGCGEGHPRNAWIDEIAARFAGHNPYRESASAPEPAPDVCGVRGCENVADAGAVCRGHAPEPERAEPSQCADEESCVAYGACAQTAVLTERTKVMRVTAQTLYMLVSKYPGGPHDHELQDAVETLADTLEASATHPLGKVTKP